MEIKIRSIDNVSVLDIKGYVDINSAQIIEVIGELLTSNRNNILCNLVDVNMVDYCGLSILAIAYKNVINHKGHMKFENISESILKLFEMVGLYKVFKVYKDEGMAISSFKGRISDIESKPLRRRFKRLPFIIKTTFAKTAKNNTAGRKSQHCTAKILNISGEGLFIRTDYMLPIETRVDVALTFEKDAEPTIFKGTVIWIADKELQPRYYPGMGIKFMNTPQHRQDKVLDFIDKNITRRSG